MTEAILVVLSKPVAGRDDDFNDWYSNIHMRDALRFRGSIAAQRFTLATTQPVPPPADFDWRYLALYEVFDAQRFSLEHWENALTPRMKITDAFDDTVLEDYHYYPVQYRNDDPGRTHAGGVVLEQMRPAAGREAEFARWCGDVHFPAAAARPDVHAAMLLVFREHGQMLPTTPSHRTVALYWTHAPDGPADWPAPSGEAAALLEPGTTQITAWSPITARLTTDQVRHTDAAALAAEERARAHMGDRLLAGGREKLEIA